jgi:NitT/TauT family transport system ATP-binding protein
LTFNHPQANGQHINAADRQLDDMTALFSAQHISKRFDNGVEALADVSFSLKAGDFVSLLGPSGCGKSTALRLIAGLLAPDMGSITFEEGKPDIGFVFQEPTLMPWADALTNTRLPLDLKHVPRAKADTEARAALARVGLTGFESVYPRELSGGMKMRVSIARALCAPVVTARPKLLLLDEPFAALDEITRSQLNDDLLRLWREDGLTVFFVTHSVAESCYLSERVLVMSPRPGRIVADIALSSHAERGADFRLAPQFIDCQRQVSAALNASSSTRQAQAQTVLAVAMAKPDRAQKP